MFYKTCPDCGANLDPGETCDCVKEKKLPATNDTASNHTQTDNGESVSETSIADFPEIVKSFDLRDLCQRKNLPGKDVVELLQKHFLGYDKTVQSKAENPDKYGVSLCLRAIDIVLRTYAPEMLEKEKRRRNGSHKLTATLFCRVDNDTAERFKAAAKKAGYQTVQAAMTDLTLQFIESEEHNGK
ncbi:MAG: hypothetical protein ILA17_06010 [Ruminococcus sp.]|nr:hypothetical protein [Ruminiclostridium sp.]MBP1537403.1 hypothetical protein [Ruminococcus sp.]